MLKCFVFVAAVFVPIALCQQASVDRCNAAWRKQTRCLKDGAAQQGRHDSSFPLPDQGSQNRIKRQVENCFKQQRCSSSPVPSAPESNARRDCFRTAKRQLDQELKRCVDGRIRGWIPVDEYPKADLDEWSYTVNRVFDGVRNSRPYCGDNRRTQALQQCVDRDAEYNFNKRPPRSLPSYWCDEDARCWGDTGNQCQDQWDNQAQPALCDCSRKLESDRRLTQPVDTYRQCVGRRIRGQVPKDDPAPNWLTAYVRDLCSNKNNHPCKKQRRFYDKRG